jgi:hypothetical protein
VNGGAARVYHSISLILEGSKLVNGGTATVSVYHSVSLLSSWDRRHEGSKLVNRGAAKVYHSLSLLFSRDRRKEGSLGIDGMKGVNW